MKYCNVPTLTQEEKKMEKNFKNVLDKILFVQNFLIGLPTKKNKSFTDKISEMNDEIKKEIGEQLG